MSDGILRVGSTFGGYRINRVLAPGAMADVYLATHLKLDTTVALKVIRRDRADDEGFVQRYLAEQRIYARLRNPHLIRTLEAGEERGLTFVAVEVVDGISLERWLQARGPLEPVTAARIVTHIASALDEAHKQGIVHRDVKPMNVLIEHREEGPWAYLVDFGLADFGTGSQGQSNGFSDYAAPEVVRAEPVDPRSDIWSLGVTLFEMLTGEPPFARKSGLELPRAILTDSAPSVTALAPNVPAAFDEVIERALAKDMNARYQSAGALGGAAVKAATSITPTVQAPSVEQEPRQPSSVPDGDQDHPQAPADVSEPERRMGGSTPPEASSSFGLGGLGAERLPVGSVFAGHRIDGIVGEGGYGVVYRAIDLELTQTVALKVIKPIISDDEQTRERFRREAKLTSSITNPHLLPIYRFGEEGKNLFFTTRYVDGVDLARLIDEERRLDPPLAARIVAQIASALDALHAHGIVHRDLKPANVLVERQDQVHAYLTDFGLAMGSDHPPLELPGQALGSLDYMSPEMIRGELPDARSDIYGLGALLYEMLTGERVFPHVQGMRILWAHLNDPRPSVDGTGVPERFDNVIAKAMAIDREDRYLSAGDLGRAANAVAAGRLPSRAQRNVATGEAAPGGLGSAIDDSRGSAQPAPVPSASSTARPVFQDRLARSTDQDRSAEPRIFVSYRRDDVPDATDRLVEALVKRFGRQNVFVDVDSIEIGAEFAKVIGDYVARCNVLLAVIGRGWLDAADEDGQRRLEDPDDYVRLEIETALARDVRVVPVLVHGASMPRQSQLPDSLLPMLRRNAAELPRQWFAPSVDQLIAAIEKSGASISSRQRDDAI